ncbi:hypothetical protein MMC12_006905 [Toensbergia leucococca]|nr:hypothetical protein [Toensbergia leucococca]
MATKSSAFQKAIADSSKLKEKPSQDELLELYALFKQGSQDPPITDTTRPGGFDMKGKYKWDAWKKVADKGLSAEAAQEKYVELVEDLKKSLGFSG